MQPVRVQFAAVDAPETRLDCAIEWILVALLAFCPFAFGAVEAWSEAIFLFLTSAMGLCLAFKLIRRPDARFVWSWTYLPIALFLVLVAMQLIPLPVGFVRAISPNTAALKTRLLADLPQANDATRWMTLTFYPEATLRQLRLVGAMGVILIVVINIFQRIESIRRLLLAISLIGLAQAALALLQDMTHSSSIYWSIPVYTEHAISGSFVNHSHFGQFMNLSIGAAIALMLLESHRRSKHDESTEGAFNVAGSWVAGVTIVACVLALLLSLTRGGVISMLAAGTFTLIVVLIKARSRRKILAGASLLVVVVLVVVAWMGFEQVYRRLTSITESNAANLRGQMLTDLREAWKQFPIFGTGLGTHAVIFPMLDRSEVVAVATHAEDEYAQTMTETGAIGLLLAITFVVRTWIKYAQSIRGTFSSISASAIGLGYGFGAILIHSASDFGQHIPADAALTAITCGLLVSLARQRRLREHSTRVPDEFQGSIPIRIVATAAVLAACGFALFQASRAWAAEREWNAARRIEDNLRQRDWQGDNSTYANLVVHAQSAARLAPRNIDFAYWLAFYRWKWISLQSDFEKDPQYLVYARQIADEFDRIRLQCPTFGLPASMAGQIQTFVLHDPMGPDRIRLGNELNHNDATACFVDGKLAASEGDWDRALQRLQHYARITGSSREVVDLYVKDFHRPDQALKASEGDPAGLEHLVDLLTKTGGDASVVATAKQRAGDLRLEAASHLEADFSDLMLAAHVAIERGDHDAAIGLLRRAANMNFYLPGLHFELGREFASVGRNKDAIDELKIAVRQQPGFTDAQKLLDQLER